MLQTLAALSICVGWWTRTASAVFFATFTWVELLDKTNYLNHYYLVSLLALLLVFMPAGRMLSVDALVSPSFKRTNGPAWVLWVMRAQIGLVYFFAGIGKLNSDWLLDAQPLRIWLGTTGEIPLVGWIFTQTWMAWPMSWGGAIFDLAIPFVLCSKRFKWMGFVGLIAFHVVTRMMFLIGMFPWIMLVNVTLFLDSDWPLKWIRKQESQVEELQVPRIWLLPVLLYGLFQICFPLRRLCYDGNYLWHERGFRFSWNVMLIEKSGDAQFVLKDKVTGLERQVRNRDWLTPQQERMMSTQADMILQFARFLAEKHPGNEVFGDVWVSWNGRSAARFIKSDVDLAKVENVKDVCLEAPPKE